MIRFTDIFHIKSKTRSYVTGNSDKNVVMQNIEVQIDVEQKSNFFDGVKSFICVRKVSTR